MIFEIDGSGSLAQASSKWAPKELEVEKIILPPEDADEPVLSPEVFGEPLLVVSNQVKTAQKKRADILALDRAGNGAGVA